MIKDYKLINKKIINNTNTEQYYKDIVLFELNNINELDIEKKNIKVFRSGRHKNDMPSVFELGKVDASFKDALIIINESGNGSKRIKQNYIISDSLTIIGSKDNAFVISFLGGDKHLIKTVIKVDKKGNFLSLQVIAELNIILKPNQEFITEDLELYYINNIVDAINDHALKKKKEIKTKKRPTVYSTWYYYGQKIDFNDCLINLDKINEYNLPFDVFEIDDGWMDYIGDYNPNNKFPSLKEIANTIKEYNLIPGIWTSPFIMDKNSKLSSVHKDWILYDKLNNPIFFNVNNQDYYIIDITIKETWDYFESLYKDLYNIGFRYFKLDFTRASIIHENANYKYKYRTIIESYKEACIAIRRGMTDDSYFLMCGGLYDPLIGIVDSERTSSDALSMWDNPSKRGGKSLPFVLKQNLLRYYMSNWWHNDYDALMIRHQNRPSKGGKLSLGLFNDKEIKTALMNQLMSSGLVSITEPLDLIDKDRLNELKHILPLRKTKIELVGPFNIKRYPNYIKLKEEDNDSIYLIIINYNNYLSIKPKIYINNIVKNEFDNKDELIIIDFYQKKIYNNLGLNSIIKLNRIKPHASTIIKIISKDKFNNKEIDYNGHYLI